MDMEALQSRVSSKGQIVLPLEIRSQLGIEQGTVLSYEVEEDRIILRKVMPLDSKYLDGLETTLSEWSSEEDEQAFRDL